MRPLTQLLDLFIFEVDPVVDEVFGEDATFHEVVMIIIIAAKAR